MAETTLTWLGHAAFRLDTADGKRIYVDPFLTGNPTCPESEQAPERVGHVELAFDGELRHAPAGRAEPALSHTVTEPPGSILSIVTPLGASLASSSGVPVSTPNVPQWHGTMRCTPSSSTATAACRGPIV